MRLRYATLFALLPLFVLVACTPYGYHADMETLDEIESARTQAKSQPANAEYAIDYAGRVQDALRDGLFTKCRTEETYDCELDQKTAVDDALSILDQAIDAHPSDEPRLTRRVKYCIADCKERRHLCQRDCHTTECDNSCIRAHNACLDKCEVEASR